jgi:hypothetical protein
MLQAFAARNVNASSRFFPLQITYPNKETRAAAVLHVAKAGPDKLFH